MQIKTVNAAADFVEINLNNQKRKSKIRKYNTAPNKFQLETKL